MIKAYSPGMRKQLMHYFLQNKPCRVHFNAPHSYRMQFIAPNHDKIIT